MITASSAHTPHMTLAGGEGGFQVPAANSELEEELLETKLRAKHVYVLIQDPVDVHLDLERDPYRVVRI